MTEERWQLGGEGRGAAAAVGKEGLARGPQGGGVPQGWRVPKGSGVPGSEGAPRGKGDPKR